MAGAAVLHILLIELVSTGSSAESFGTDEVCRDAIEHPSGVRRPAGWRAKVRYAWAKTLTGAAHTNEQVCRTAEGAPQRASLSVCAEMALATVHGVRANSLIAPSDL